MFFTGTSTSRIIDAVKEKSITISKMDDLNVLMDKIGDARIVMLGEASHGTHEYYTWRSYITKKLVQEKGFNFIAVEGDWPDCYKINQYIKGNNEAGGTALEILKTFHRWPTWMWANWEIVALTEWLHQYNQNKKDKIGFYGLDVYSLWDSLEEIRKYLQQNDPEALRKAEAAYDCFEPYKTDDGSSYAYASQLVPELCQDEVIALLKEFQNRITKYDGNDEQVFSAEQNALIAVNAEKYYRAMIKGGAQSWNVRDSHMEETLDRLLNFHGPHSKAIVWEHNTHIGDSSATDMKDEGMYNIGELARSKYPKKDVFLVGFGSYKGSVIAGKSWGAEMRVMEVPNARKDSWEYIQNKAGAENKLLLMDDFKNIEEMQERIGHRAIGVVYRPQFEHYGNYVPSVMTDRYDAFIFINETRALHPLHITPDSHQMPDTYPFGT